MNNEEPTNTELDQDVPLPSVPAAQTQQLIPEFSRQTTVERRLAISILKLDPGMGPKSQEVAHLMCDAGLNPSFAITLIRAIYSPTDPKGRGQAMRVNHAVAAIRNRYGHRLENIRKDTGRCKVFLSEMEDVFEMRDILNGEGMSISFEEAFLLSEMGLDADTTLAIVQELCEDVSWGIASRMIVRAAQCVRNGHFMALETALAHMRYGYQYEPRRS